MSDYLFDTNPVGENLDGFFSNIWRLSPDQIAQLSPEGLVYAFRLAEIVYTAIRYEDSGDFDSNLRYWLALGIILRLMRIMLTFCWMGLRRK